MIYCFIVFLAILAILAILYSNKYQIQIYTDLLIKQF